jgi:hypothetical protein
LATGLFTLGGVIVGAVATTGSQAYLEKKREEREADRAKQLVAGELLHLQMVFRGASAGTRWPPIEEGNAYLPNSAWQEYRSRLADTVDEDLWDQLVMAYVLLELDRARFVTAAKLIDRPLAPSEAASLRQTGYHLGRLRRRLGDGGGGWPDEIAEEQTESFMQWVDGLSEDDLKNDTVIVRVKQIANELAELKQDDGDAWLAEINRRLERGNPARQ